MQVLGRANSINVQKVMWCAHELKLDVERQDIGGTFGGNDTPEFLALNPNGQIPVLCDGDFALWESHAIVRYLCNRYSPAAWQPSCPMEQGRANQWMDWNLTTLHPQVTVIFWQLIRTAKSERDVQAIEEARARCSDLWGLVDRHLADREYLLGDQISMADIPLGCSAYRWFALDIDRPDLVHLTGWYKRLSERQAFRSQVMHPLT